MAIWWIVRRKVVNGGHSSASSILGQSWKSKRATAPHPRYYGALAKETSLVARGSQMVPI